MLLANRYKPTERQENKKTAKLFWHCLILFTLGVACLNSTGFSAEKKNPYVVKNEFVKFGLYPRTPEQMAAFYEGRGLPKQAIEVTSQHCFITVGMRNISKTKIWLDLDNWRIFNEQGLVNRTDHDQWKQTWKQLQVPLANQATFRWTLLPEIRDLHPDEPVGDNITLQRIDTPFTVEAKFVTGEDKKGKPFTIKIENVRCLENGEKVS